MSALEMLSRIIAILSMKMISSFFKKPKIQVYNEICHQSSFFFESPAMTVSYRWSLLGDYKEQI